MADKTHIAWTDATWSPLLGCSPKGPGCAHCYAVRDVWRMAHNPHPDISEPRQGLVEKTSAGVLRWTGKVAVLNRQMSVPLHWRRPRKIFVCNQSDLFHESVDDRDIERVFAVMLQAPQHTFQVLTKRPERMARWFAAKGTFRHELSRAPARNIWAGFSASTQDDLDKGAPWLLQVPAAIRFFSLEPLVGGVDLRRYLGNPLPRPWPFCIPVDGGTPPRGVDWVIVGGESGPGARRCDVAWIRSLVEQCRAAGLPAFVKQLGSHWAHQPRTHESYFLGSASAKGAAPEDWPEDLRVQEFPEVRR